MPLALSLLLAGTAAASAPAGASTATAKELSGVKIRAALGLVPELLLGDEPKLAAALAEDVALMALER